MAMAMATTTTILDGNSDSCEKQGNRHHNDSDGRHNESKGWHGNGKKQQQQGDRRHDDGDGRHDDGMGMQVNMWHNNGDGLHDDGDGWYEDGRHDDGKGQKEAAAAPPVYQPQHHRQNVNTSPDNLDFLNLSTVFEI